MKAITTKYLPQTRTKPARIKAFDLDGNSAVIGYPHEEQFTDRHRLAAVALCEKMGWSGAETLIEGKIKGNNSVFVFPPKTN